jgi:tetratricopeptide (TPR) repeat protein
VTHVFGPLLMALALSQQPPPQEPPEEDATDRPREYALNPLQASKEFSVGNYYWKKGNFKGAALRYEEATRWNPGYADAYLRWAEALEKLQQAEKARPVYAKFLELAPDHKRAPEVKKRLGRKG